MSNKGAKVVVFADLDGSLLNGNYDFKAVEPTINKLLLLNVAIVFASSKTRKEIEFYREKMNIRDPFIAENGSAIFIPENYFKLTYKFSKQISGYNVIELGAPYVAIREKLAAVKTQTGAAIVGFGDMTAEEIAKDSGLPLFLAKLAKEREYSEPFKIVNGDEKKVLQATTDAGLSVTRGGRYFHALGNSDKGKAAAVLADLFTKNCGETFTVGVGNSPNDLAMLNTVDKPFYVEGAEIEVVWDKIFKLAKEYSTVKI